MFTKRTLSYFNGQGSFLRYPNGWIREYKTSSAIIVIEEAPNHLHSLKFIIASSEDHLS